MKPSEKFKAGTLIKPKENFWHLDGFNPLSHRNDMFSGVVLWNTKTNEIGHISEHKEHMLHNKGVDVGDMYLIITPPTFGKIPAFFNVERCGVTYIGMVVLFENRLWEIGIVVRTDDKFIKYMLKRYSYHQLFESPDRWFEIMYGVVNDPG